MTNKVYYNNSYKKFAKYQRMKYLDLILKKKLKSILDVGCSIGQAFYYLKKKGFDGKYLGIDPDKNSIAIAKKNFAFKNCLFKHQKLQTFKSKKKFDAIIFWSVIGYFENYEKIYNKYFYYLNKNGFFLIFNNFNNSQNTDTILYAKEKTTDNHLKKKTGQNTFSLNRHNNFLRKKKMILKINSFNLTKKIARIKKNPYASYTINSKNKKIIVSDLNVWHRLYHIEAKKKF
jgi:2-polyprenyl-3-methyl-5-hydroxy-6-metoxy-1,4-benzoquinol methylase